MDFRLVGVTAVAGAVAIGALGYAAGVSGRAAAVADVPAAVPAIDDDERAEIQAMIAAAADQPLTEAERAEVAALVRAAPPDGTGGSAGALSSRQRADVEALIRTHLIANPEIIADAITELQAREAQAELTAQIDAITANAELIFSSANDVVLGNPDGDVTIVEFFDYNCSFCKRAVADVRALLEADPGLKVILKEFPVLGEGSVQAAQVSVAVNAVAPEKAAEFHFTLLEERGQVDGARARAVAEELGIDLDAVNALVDSEEVNDVINEVYAIAGELNLTGTPTFVTENEVVVGAVGFDQLLRRVTALRSSGGPAGSDDG